MLQKELPVQKNTVVRGVGNQSLKKSGSFICSSDSEIIGYALDTLYNVISNDLEEEEQGKRLVPSNSCIDCGAAFLGGFAQIITCNTMWLTNVETCFIIVQLL